MGLHQLTEVQSCIEKDNTDQPPALRPAVNTQSSETPIETTPSSGGSVTSARPKQLLDYFRKPQPTEEQDCYADWLRSVFSFFRLFRRCQRCQREISGVVFKYKDLNENQPQVAIAAPAPSTQALRSPMEQPDSQQTGTSQHQQMCSTGWQPLPLAWSSNVHNHHVSVWGSREVQWVQQQQFQQARPVSVSNPAMTFSSPPHKGGSQEYRLIWKLGDICFLRVQNDKQKKQNAYLFHKTTFGLNITSHIMNTTPRHFTFILTIYKNVNSMLRLLTLSLTGQTLNRLSIYISKVCAFCELCQLMYLFLSLLVLGAAHVGSDCFSF